MLGFDVEQEILKRGFALIGAIDEAGRGPLAGPVVAACVTCRPDFNAGDPRLDLVKDSKILSEEQREMAYDEIFKLYYEVGIGICEHNTIDRINILEASFLAMKKAIGGLKHKPDFILLDGKFPVPNISIEQRAIVRGDRGVLSIAAASIVAKVVRDRIMRGWHDYYPKYGFSRHKGYGTKAHVESLQKNGPCPIHRKTFEPVKSMLRTHNAQLVSRNA